MIKACFLYFKSPNENMSGHFCKEINTLKITKSPANEYKDE